MVTGKQYYDCVSRLLGNVPIDDEKLVIMCKDGQYRQVARKHCEYGYFFGLVDVYPMPTCHIDGDDIVLDDYHPRY